MSVAALRQRLAVLIAPPRVGNAAVSTGIVALDRALSEGGVPYGRFTEVLGARGSGKTTLTRQIVAAAVAAGRWVAYIDGTRTLAPRDWAAVGGGRGLWIIRPPNVERSAWCADVLLRSGAFDLVVLDGGPPLSRPIAIRLARLAGEHHAALLIVGDGRAGTMVGSAVRLRVRRQSTVDGRQTGAERGLRRSLQGWAVQDLPSRTWGRPMRLQVVVEKGGGHQSVEVNCAIDVARRLCTHPEVPDRRGVAPRNRRGERAAPDAPGKHRSTGAGVGDNGRQPITDRGARKENGEARSSGRWTLGTAPALPRKQRCAEPIVRRDGFLLAGGCRQ